MSAADAAAAGMGRLILLTGDEGVGKTRLAEEVLQESRNREFLVARARCVQSNPVVFFLAVRELLRELDWAAISHPGQMPRLRPEVEQAMSPAGGDVSEVLDTAEQAGIVSEVTSFISSLALEAPIVLFVDDIQWADTGTFRLIEQVAEGTRHARVCLIAACRDDACLQSLPALERLAEKMTIRNLSFKGTTALTGTIMHQGEVSEGFGELVQRRTGGNPRKIEDMIRSLGGRFELTREIGAGGMGRVFQAMDGKTGKTVAVKVMFAQDEADLDTLLRFQQEGAVLSTLKHPNIVKVYGSFLEQQAGCIVMELVEGASLGQILRSGRLDLARCKVLLQQVASALVYAHGRSIVHSDIKPDNILVANNDRIKVTDFGVARLLRPEVSASQATTAAPETFGTPLYMAPEQVQGHKLDGRTDVYALGAVAYHMVTGRPPFQANDSLAVALKHLEEAPLPPRALDSRIPEDWQSLIVKCLEKDPAARFQSASSLEQAVSELSDGQSSPASPSSTQEDAAKTGSIAPAMDRTGRNAPEETRLLRVPKPLQTKTGDGPAAPTGTAAVEKEERVRSHRHTRPIVTGVAAALLISMGLAGLYIWKSTSAHRTAAAAPAWRFVAQWGTAGSRTGRFRDPEGVAIGAGGNIYVSDYNNNRIQVLSPRGTPIASFGTRSGGQAPGQFHGPAGVALDSAGNIYVADSNNSRIQKLSTTGRPLAVWSSGSGGRIFRGIHGLAVDSSGSVYVADYFANQVDKLAPSGNLVAKWGGLGSGAGQFNQPVDVAVDRVGNIFVADFQNNRVQKLSPAGKALAEFTQWGKSGTAFARPHGVAIDKHGNIFVADYANNVIQELSSGGKPIAQIGGPGAGGGRFTHPVSVAVDDAGNLYLADSGNNRIEKFSLVR